MPPKEALTVVLLLATFITDRHCLKSPENIIFLPPNGIVFPKTSCKDLCKASRRNLWSMDASSMTIIFAILIRSARQLFASIQHKESSVGERGALNLEWNVLPRCSKLLAIPVVPVASATEPELFDCIHLTAARMELSINVLPVPPLASMKI